MSIEVKIPAVGESVSSGIISVWHKSTGERVANGETLLTLETDKVSTEIAAEADGKLEILVEEGREVKVGEVVARIEEAAAGDSAGGGSPEPESGSREDATPREDGGGQTGREEKDDGGGQQEAQPSEAEMGPADRQEDGEDAPQGDDDPGRHGPAVRRMLEEEDVSPSEIVGSGKENRITKEDVQEYLRRREAEDAEEAEPAGGSEDDADGREMQDGPPHESADDGFRPDRVEADRGGDRVLARRESASDAVPITTRRRMSPMRRKIAAQLVKVKQEAAILTTFNECDMSAVKAIRSRMQENFQRRHDIKLGFMSFFVKAVVNALQEVPAINARIDGDDIIENHFYDIGVAVGTDRGLVVPVIRNADRKSFAEIEKELADFAARAQDGRIQLDELRGGVFSISNGGVYGSLFSTPILNPPQSGILGMHAIQERSVVVGGEVQVRPMMYLALSYDHRVVDGKQAVTFLVRVKEAIEDPMQLIL